MREIERGIYWAQQRQVEVSTAAIYVERGTRSPKSKKIEKRGSRGNGVEGSEVGKGCIKTEKRERGRKCKDRKEIRSMGGVSGRGDWKASKVGV